MCEHDEDEVYSQEDNALVDNNDHNSHSENDKFSGNDEKGQAEHDVAVQGDPTTASEENHDDNDDVHHDQRSVHSVESETHEELC